MGAHNEASVSLPVSFQLLEELKEEEEDMVSLQNYTAMLLQRVVDNSPELLDSIDCQSVHIQTVK